MMNSMQFLFAFTAALSLFSPGTNAVFASPPTDGRQPVPADADVAQSRQLVRSAYEEEYQTARQSGEPADLIAILLDSVDASEDAARKYSLLMEAEELATQNEDVAAALSIVDRRAQLFEIDGLQQRAESLERLAGPKVSGDIALLSQAMQTARLAAAAERFDIALDAGSLAVNIARSIDRAQKSEARKQPRRPAEREKRPVLNGPTLIKESQELVARINDFKKAFEAYQGAASTLDKDPEDVDANTATGTYLCLIARNWEKGLPYLGKSKLQPIRDLANEECLVMSTTPTDTNKLFGLAGKWWAVASSQEVVNGSAEVIRQHAASLYHIVLPQLTDPLERRLAETRIQSCECGLMHADPHAPEEEVLVLGGRARRSLKLPNGWTQHQQFIEGIGQVRGTGPRSQGDPCPLRIIPEVGTADFSLTVVLSVEKLDGTAAGFLIHAGDGFGVLGLDGFRAPRNLFVDGGLFGLSAPRVLGFQPKPSQPNTFVITRRGSDVVWKYDDKEVAAVQISQDQLGALDLIPVRGHLRVYEIRLARAAATPLASGKK